MTIASKFTLALLACVIVAVMGFATTAVRSELARSESDIVEHEAATAHALRPAIRDVWLHDGEARALELVDEARQRLRSVDVRLVSHRPGRARGEASACRCPPAGGPRGRSRRRRDGSSLRANRADLHLRPRALRGRADGGDRSVPVARRSLRGSRRGAAQRGPHGAAHRRRLGVRHLVSRPGTRRATSRGARGAGPPHRRGRPLVSHRDKPPRRDCRAGRTK